MSDSKQETKDFFRNYGILLGILIVFLGIIFGLSFLNRNLYSNGIRDTVQELLDSKFEGKYLIKNELKITTGIANTASLYEVYSKDSAERFYVTVIRTPTMYGPMPAVFLYNKNSGPTFIGYCCVKGRVKKILEENSNDIRITYWLSKIQSIVENSKRLEDK